MSAVRVRGSANGADPDSATSLGGPRGPERTRRMSGPDRNDWMFGELGRWLFGPRGESVDSEPAAAAGDDLDDEWLVEPLDCVACGGSGHVRGEGTDEYGLCPLCDGTGVA